MIYFVKTGDYVLVTYLNNKRDLKKVLSHLDSFNPFSAKVIGALELEPKAQKIITSHLDDCHIKDNWFIYSDELEDYLLNPKTKKDFTPNRKRVGKVKKEARENSNEIIETYLSGATPDDLQKEFGIHRKYLAKMIPKKLRRREDDWSFRKVNKKARKAVLCIDTGEIFDSVGEASRVKEAPKVSEVCRGKRIKSNGLKFRYLTEEEKHVVNALKDGIDKIFYSDIIKLL